MKFVAIVGLAWGIVGLSAGLGNAQTPPEAAKPAAAAPAAAAVGRLVELGPGDQVTLEVYGQPDMTSTLYVGDDGTISVPLAGAVQVSGLTPVVAAKRVEAALVAGQFLRSPHVTIALLVGKSQRVSVVGEVKTPNRYNIEPNTSIFDLLALAGGTTENASDVVYILRTASDGKVSRYPLDLKALSGGGSIAPEQRLQSGDQVLVPPADKFSIYGEVAKPDMYRIERGMTVVEAIARAGGITPRGSDRRVDIKRKGADGKYTVVHASPNDLVRADDVIRVKESIF